MSQGRSLLSRWTSISDWADRVREVAAPFRAAPPVCREPTYSLDPRVLEKTVVRWPRTERGPKGGSWANYVLGGLRRWVRVEPCDTPQPYLRAVVFQVVFDGRSHDVALDFSDYLTPDEDCTRNCELVFKLQYARQGYPQPHILPGGYTANFSLLFRMLGYIRSVGDRQTPLYDVYGRYSLDYAPEIRSKAVELLSKATGFRYQGGLSKLRYSRFLSEIARSRICIDLPGNGPFCHRLVDYLAVGACVIAYPHTTRLHEPLVDRQHVVYTREDLSDLVELCHYYLDHEEQRHQIRAESRRYFDRHLHCDQLAAYYLHHCMERLGD